MSFVKCIHPHSHYPNKDAENVGISQRFHHSQFVPTPNTDHAAYLGTLFKGNYIVSTILCLISFFSCKLLNISVVHIFLYTLNDINV